jgi:hypothetical protein
MNLDSLQCPTPGTYTFYEGAAPKHRDPISRTFSGDLMAVENFLQTRPLDEAPDNVTNPGVTKSIILVEAEKKTITLHTNPTDPASLTIIGSAKDNPDLSDLNINLPLTFTRDGLIKKLRFSAHLFSDQDEYRALLGGLQRFSASTSGKVGADTDNRGNKAIDYQKKVQTGLPETITLIAEPIIGAQKVKFAVEVCLDVTDGGGAKFWFESPELVVLQKQAWDNLSALGLQTAKEKGITIIYS